jgi:hypothetical protein
MADPTPYAMYLRAFTLSLSGSSVDALLSAGTSDETRLAAVMLGVVDAKGQQREAMDPSGG